MNGEKKFGFSINQARLEEIVKQIVEARISRQGIFSIAFKTFLPQWNLPKELEFNPQRIETIDPLSTAKYLWTCVFFERLSQSRVIMRNAQRVWNSDKRWIFYPEKVVEKDIFEIDEVLKNRFQFGLMGNNEEHPSERFRYNSYKIMKEYMGDPRTIIQWNSVEEARKKLMEFKGIGTGIANLYIIYLLDRKIALPTNPEDILFKIDIHKGRIPLNTNALIPENGEVYREDIAKSLEHAYLNACKNRKIDPSLADASLWIIGSEVCVKRDYNVCCMYCPLVDKYCVSNVAQDENTGRFKIYDPNGKRIETRKNMGQRFFNFGI